MIAISLTLMLAVVVSGALAQFILGIPCPVGGGNFCVSSFSPIILRCSSANGILFAGNCADDLAGDAPVGVKTDAICGNSTVNNADCFLPPYPPFIVNSASTSPPSPTSTTAIVLRPRVPYLNSTTTSTTIIVTPIPTTSKSISISSTSVLPNTHISGVGGMFVPIGGVCGLVLVIVFGLL